MDRVKRQKTMVKDPQCLTLSKKRDESEDNNDLISILPLELKIEILLKLSAKSIAKFNFVSKQWSSTVRCKDFTKLYMTRSLTRPRLLYKVYRSDTTQFFQSCSQLDDDDPSSDHRRVTITSNPDLRRGFSQHIHGLICCLNDRRRVMIRNPSTGQFVTLPSLKNRTYGMRYFFGYEPVNDVYKVLCLRKTYVGKKYLWNVGTQEHQVFTLGAEQEWRMIECKHPHRLPDDVNCNGICMNGVVYYLGATIITFKLRYKDSIISFDLISEEFGVIKLPKNVKHVDIRDLVIYSGKIALTNGSVSDGRFDIFVLEDVSKREWSKTSLLVPCWTDVVGIVKRFKFKGTLSTGELIFSPAGSPKPFFIISYDINANTSARKVVVEGTGGNNDSADIAVFLDHVENPMLLPNMTQSDDDDDYDDDDYDDDDYDDDDDDDDDDVMMNGDEW